MTHITTEAEEEPISRVAQNMGVEDINLFSGEEISDPNIYTVFLNGSYFSLFLNQVILPNTCFCKQVIFLDWSRTISVWFDTLSWPGVMATSTRSSLSIPTSKLVQFTSVAMVVVCAGKLILVSDSWTVHYFLDSFVGPTSSSEKESQQWLKNICKN